MMLINLQIFLLAHVSRNTPLHTQLSFQKSFSNLFVKMIDAVNLGRFNSSMVLLFPYVCPLCGQFLSITLVKIVIFIFPNHILFDVIKMAHYMVCAPRWAGPNCPMTGGCQGFPSQLVCIHRNSLFSRPFFTVSASIRWHSHVGWSLSLALKGVAIRQLYFPHRSHYFNADLKTIHGGTFLLSSFLVFSLPTFLPSII